MSIVDAMWLLNTLAQRDIYCVWVRPISWRGTGSGICRIAGRPGLYIVPDNKGGTQWTPTSKEILGLWEVASYGFMHDER